MARWKQILQWDEVGGRAGEGRLVIQIEVTRETAYNSCVKKPLCVETF